MALTLRVTSFHSQALGPQAAMTFGEQGGSIGRKADNDWVLPDPERFISGHHAHIVCRNGVYYLRDLSVNGTFWSCTTTCVPKASSHPSERPGCVSRWSFPSSESVFTWSMSISLEAPRWV